jgi:hypothetical protein
MAKTATKGAPKAAPTTDPATPTVRYSTAMQQLTADLVATDPCFKAVFMKQVRAGRGVTNRLVGTKAQFDAVVALLTAKLPTLEGAVKTQVASGLTKGWYNPALLAVYSEVAPKAAVAK